MNMRHGVDLTEGNVMGHMIRFSLPLFAGSALQVLYNTVDSIWVGRFLGKEALGAVSISFTIIFLLVSLVMGFGMATSTIIAQYYGAKDDAMVKKTIHTSFTSIGIGSVILSFLGVWGSGWLLRMMNTPGEIIGMATQYLAVFFTGLVFLFGFNILMAIFRGLGDATTPLKFLIISTVLNLVLDPLFIFVFKLHVAGAALATVVSQGIAFFLGVWYLRRANHILSLHIKDLNFDRDILKMIFKLGLPSSVQQTMVSAGMVVLAAFVNRFGPDAVAAYGAGSRIDAFAFMPAMSLNVAISSIVGQNMGAGKTDRVKITARYGILMAFGIMFIIYLFVNAVPRPLLSMFTAEPVVLNRGVEYLRIESISYMFFGVMFVLVGVFRGAGDVIAPMFITLLGLWGIRIPLAWVFSEHTPLGVAGIWWGITVSLFIAMLLTGLYYKTGRWKNKTIVKHSTGGEVS